MGLISKKMFECKLRQFCTLYQNFKLITLVSTEHQPVQILVE